MAGQTTSSATRLRAATADARLEGQVTAALSTCEAHQAKAEVSEGEL